MGVFSNVNSNLFTFLFQYFNPMRFYAEIALRCIANNKHLHIGSYKISLEDTFTQKLDYTLGTNNCFLCLSVSILVTLLLASASM